MSLKFPRNINPILWPEHIQSAKQSTKVAFWLKQMDGFLLDFLTYADSVMKF